MTFKEFLEKVPPGREVEVSDAFSQFQPPDAPLGNRCLIPEINQPRGIWLSKPELYLYCDRENCRGMRFFESIGDREKLKDEVFNNKFLMYRCKNCEKYWKTFAIRLLPLKDTSKLFKYGEYPAFGPPTPPRAITLIGPDNELFFTGRRAESQGMGIGAFTYYRRVVENQKNRIFDEIIRATKKIKPGDPVIQELETAKNETQFVKAVEKIKHALPESLLIHGLNPLNLLHSALSKGLHDHTDAECLELASDIRTILFEFADRLGQALKEESKLDTAVKRLTKKLAKKD